MRVIATTLSVIVLTACAVPSTSTESPKATASGLRGGDVEEGLRAMRAANYDAAIKEFNRALARTPENAPLHLLAGMAYHLSALRGNASSIELAEVGYSVASRIAPSNPIAPLQLARLHMDTKDYMRAQLAYARVLDLERDDPRAALGFAIASYYVGDLEAAEAGVRLAERLRPRHRETLRAAALIHSAAGLEGDALAVRESLNSAGAPADDLRYIDRRMAQWNDVHRTLLAQAPPQPQPFPPPSPFPSAPGTAVAPHWADCGTGLQQAANVMPTGVGIDETTALNPLPSPCTGRPLPRMIQLDATFIATEESIDTKKGVNLLEGLQAVLGASRAFVQTQVGTEPTPGGGRTFTTNWSVGLPQAGVTYSLNIANAADVRADVLARPTLLALDRMPATFFSGKNLTIAITGNIGGGNLVEKPIGTSLSVTPTFIDDETMLLAVKVARSDLEIGQPGSFDQALHTTRNVVNSTAILKFDQTLILSGLLERESTFSKAGIPGLRDVPVVQYLSSTAATEEAQTSVLVTITPRRVSPAGPGGGVRAPTEAERNDPILAEIRQRLSSDYRIPSIAISAMRSLRANRYMAQFRAGDLKDEEWRAPEPLEAMFQDVRRFLYY